MCGWPSLASGRGGVVAAAFAIAIGGRAFADTIDVPGDYPTIQAAIDAAVDGDEIVIADGTWTGPGNRNLDTGGRSIVIRSSGGASVCTIDCEELGRAFFIHMGETVRLVGLSVVGGFLDDMGGGAVLVRSSYLTVKDCIFSGNRVGDYGYPGGGAVLAESSHVTLEDSIFIGNRVDYGGGGAILCDGGSMTMTDCTLIANQVGGDCDFDASGGGLSVRQAETTLLRCEFRSNSALGSACGGTGNALGGGTALQGAYGRITAINCMFRNNIVRGDGDFGEAWGGGAWVDDPASALFVNCMFAGNTAEDAKLSGGARGGAFAGSGALINCTIAGNTIDAYGEPVAGGVFAYGACTLTNCIVWGNGPDGIEGPAVVEYSDVEGGWPGIGNTDADPMFADAASGDYRLQSGSPCADAGVNNAVPPDIFDLDDDGETAERLPLDLDGNPRFNADELDFDPGCGVPVVVDMGAYEYQFEPVEEVLVGDVDGDGVIDFGDLLQVLSNWGVCNADCCLGDVDFTWEVGFNDLLIVLSNWS